MTDDGTNNEPDGVVDGNDPWYRFVYGGVQVIATRRCFGRGSDSDPKERIVEALDSFANSGGE